MADNFPLNIAHRGASGFAPENTKSAFLEAINAQADVIELDVHVTKDKQLVVIHDSTINRTSNGKGWVHLMTLRQLRKYDYGFPHSKEKILTLQEALSLIGTRTKIIVECKLSVKKNEELILQAIKQVKNRQNIWLHTSHGTILKRIRRKDKDVRLGRVIIFSFLYHLLLPWYLWFAKKYSITFFSIDELFVNKPFATRFLRKLKRNNIEAYLWTVNSLHSVYQAVEVKADGIITNFPEMVQHVKEQSGKKPTSVSRSRSA